MGEEIIPKAKKKIREFLREDKGSISKHSMFAIGTFISTIAASSLLSLKDVKASSITIGTSDTGDITTVTASHSHHSSHSSHGSHSSHSSHSSHGSHGSHGSSDERLKKDIANISDPIKKISKLRGINFNWKDDHHPGMGVLAQDVEKVFPELVIKDEKGMRMVEYDKLVAPLIEAVKEQQKEIENLKNELAMLKGRDRE